MVHKWLNCQKKAKSISNYVKLLTLNRSICSQAASPVEWKHIQQCSLLFVQCTAVKPESKKKKDFFKQKRSIFVCININLTRGNRNRTVCKQVMENLYYAYFYTRFSQKVGVLVGRTNSRVFFTSASCTAGIKACLYNACLTTVWITLMSTLRQWLAEVRLYFC